MPSNTEDYLKQFVPVNYTAPEGMKKPGDAGFLGSVIDALSVALNPENPGAAYNAAMQRQAQLKQDNVGYLSGIATDFLSKNPGADVNVVDSILRKTAPDVYNKVDKSEVFNAIQKSIEPIVRFNENDLKNEEVAREKDFAAWDTNRPVFAVVGGVPQFNPMYEKVGRSAYEKYFKDEGFSVKPLADGRLMVTKDGYKLGDTEINKIMKKAETDGVSPNNILRRFVFGGLDQGEMTDTEKYAAEERLAKIRKADKSKSREEIYQYFDEHYDVKPGSSIEKWKEDPETEKDYLEALDQAREAYYNYVKNPQDPKVKAAYFSAMEGRFDSKDAVKRTYKTEESMGKESRKTNLTEKTLDYNKRASAILSDKKASEKEKSVKLNLLWLEIFGDYVPGTGSSSEKPKWTPVEEDQDK